MSQIVRFFYMNKHYLSKIFVLISGIFLFAVLSCKGGEPAALKTDSVEIEGELRFETIAEERAIVLYPQRSDSPRMLFNLTLLDIHGPEPLQSLLLDALYGGRSPEEYANSLIAGFENQYLTMRDPGGPSAEKLPAALNWDYTETFQALARTPHTAVLSKNREYYTGGAHGMRETAYFVFALDEAKRLRLEDIFEKGTEPLLRDYIMAALRTRQGLAPGAPLSKGGFFEDSVAVSEDFFLNREGLGFQWDVYEIAPYVMGPIEVLIPYEKIRPLCGPRGRALIGEFQ
jgi:hypothetical protein